MSFQENKKRFGELKFIGNSKTRKLTKVKNHNQNTFLNEFSSFYRETKQMEDMKDVKARSVDELEVLVGQGDMDAKRELARRLMEGNGVPQNHPKAVALLEDCVALGDTDAMIMLVNCYTLALGMEHNAERAESLICEAANKGNHEAVCLMWHNNWKGKCSIDLDGLSCSLE